MNTAFISSKNTLRLFKSNLSPDSIKKDERISNEFMIQFLFEDYCKSCNKPWQMEVEDFCENCKNVLY